MSSALRDAVPPETITRLNPARFGPLTQKPTAWRPFPDVDPLMIPCGDSVLVQVRTPRTTTEGGIQLPDEAVETEKWNVQTARVLAVGPVAYRNRTTLEPWPEGAWIQAGDYVRVPKFGGDRWEVEYGEGRDQKALFCLFRDVEIRAKIPGGYEASLKVKAYVL